MKFAFFVLATIIWMTVATGILLNVFGLSSKQLDVLATDHQFVLVVVLASVPLALMLRLTSARKITSRR